MNTCRKACSNVSIKALVAFFVAVFAVVVLSGCASQSYTPEKKQSILSASALHTDGVLRVGVDASSAPYAAQSQGDIMGIDVDIAAALADEMGLKLELVDVGSNVDSAFSQENVDIVMGVETTSTAFWTSEPYMESAIVLFASDPSTSAPTSGSFTIAAQSSSMSAWQVNDHFGEEHLMSEADLKSAFEDLQAGKVNYVAADSTIGAYIAHSLGIEAYPVALLQDKTEYRIACPSTASAVQTAVTNSLTTLQRGGIITVIENKWLGEMTPLSNLPRVTTTVNPPENDSATTNEAGSNAVTADEGDDEDEE